MTEAKDCEKALAIQGAFSERLRTAVLEVEIAHRKCSKGHEVEGSQKHTSTDEASVPKTGDVLADLDLSEQAVDISSPIVCRLR